MSGVSFFACLPSIGSERNLVHMNSQGKADNEPGSGTQDPESMAGMMAKCCQGMESCRWFPLCPIIVGVILFLLGYLLNADLVRLLWLVVSGAIVLMGLVGVMMVSVMFRR